MKYLHDSRFSPDCSNLFKNRIHQGFKEVTDTCHYFRKSAINNNFKMSWGAPPGQNPAYAPGQFGQQQQHPPPTYQHAPPNQGYSRGAPPNQGYSRGAPPNQGYSRGAPPPQQSYNPQYQQPAGGGAYQASPQGGYQPTGGQYQPPQGAGYQPAGPGAASQQRVPTAGYQAAPPGGYQPQGSAVYPGGYQQQGPGGYQPPPQGPPPGVSLDHWQWFQAVDADKSGKITPQELQQALMNGNWTPFNQETCRLMISMFDRDRSGTIDVQEFSALWKYIQDWRACFERFDTDRSGNINASELESAFRSFGYNLSANFCNMCVRVFDRRSTSTMNFDDFIQCCVMLKGLTESFKAKDKQQQGVVNVHYEEFLNMVLETPLFQ